jgi:hypothetical protein
MAEALLYFIRSQLDADPASNFRHIPRIAAVLSEKSQNVVAVYLTRAAIKRCLPEFAAEGADTYYSEGARGGVIHGVSFIVVETVSPSSNLVVQPLRDDDILFCSPPMGRLPADHTITLKVTGLGPELAWIYWDTVRQCRVPGCYDSETQYDEETGRISWGPKIVEGDL